MDRDDRDPIFVDDSGSHVLCFDSCDRFLDGCRDCDKVRQYGAGAGRPAQVA